MTPLLLIPAVIWLVFEVYTNHKQRELNRLLVQIIKVRESELIACHRQLNAFRRIQQSKQAAVRRVLAQMEGGRYGRG